MARVSAWAAGVSPGGRVPTRPWASGARGAERAGERGHRGLEARCGNAPIAEHEPRAGLVDGRAPVLADGARGGPPRGERGAQPLLVEPVGKREDKVHARRGALDAALREG